MSDDFFDDVSPRTDYSRGGARPNSGPKSGHKSATRDVPTEKLTDFQRKERAAADKEEALARQAAVKADLDEGVVVNRDDVQAAAAKAFALCSQSLDAIADNLERQLGVAPEIAQKVEQFINQAKAQLAEDLQRLGAFQSDSNDDLFT